MCVSVEQNWIQKWSHTFMDNWFLVKVQKQFNGGRIAIFQRNKQNKIKQIPSPNPTTFIKVKSITWNWKLEETKGETFVM